MTRRYKGVVINHNACGFYATHETKVFGYCHTREELEDEIDAFFLDGAAFIGLTSHSIHPEWENML